MNTIVSKGHLLPDSLILRVIHEYFQDSLGKGQDCFLLDGFPRSAPQAEALESFANVRLALDLDLREEVLLEKCLGRRICSKCGKNYNIADIKLPASDGRSEIIMPPLPPPPECEPYMEQRHDDTEEVIRRRLQIYKDSAEPVKEFYRQRGILINFEITGGIPETFPRLKALLEPYTQINGAD